MSQEPSTVLMVARHGNTFASGDVVTRVGITDLPLVESGREQGRLLGQYLLQHDLVPDVIFTSRLQRTRQTADEAEFMMNTKLPRQELDIFNEIDYGPDENQPEEKVRERLGDEAIRKWDEEAVVPDGWKVNAGDTIDAWKDFAGDVLANYANKKILVVTSNGIARFSYAALGGDDQAKRDLKIATGALCVFDYDIRYEGWKCVEWGFRPGKAVGRV